MTLQDQSAREPSPEGPDIADDAVPDPSLPDTSELSDAVLDDPVLDNPVWSSLTGHHAHQAVGNDLVKHFPEDVSPFVGVKDWEHPDVWDAVLDLFGHGATVGVSHADPVLPEGWEQVFSIPGVQLTQTALLRARPDSEALELGAADSPDMLALVERTKPGPFLPRTHELGRYVGVRREGRLIAMAGERLHPDGWTEISGVAVDADHRRQGLASRLVLDVAFHIQQRGDRALLHASAANTGAISGYEKLGFALRRRVTFGAVRTP
ncbi:MULTISPECIES: GNAT family N-acetyltransferase [unclassified Brachybacterium]|uniref:GNAT family N-acetyltransferase n=1 Tax=unclassified Brachybacterium TaxID=2623841 RepID=UPI000A1AA274|nr:acetyltransferase [Corynebacterium xerosis]